MKYKSILKNHKEFESNIEEIIKYSLEKIILNPRNGKISSRETSILLEAFILKICALWESFVEKEIVLTTFQDQTNLFQLMELKKNNKLDVSLIRAVLFSDTYRGFQDINRLVDFSKKVIVDNYNPFLEISNEQKTKIHFVYTIRNYLSHYSNYSKKKLLLEYKKIYEYKVFLEPVTLLLKNKGKLFEELANNFCMTSVHMRKIFI